MINSTKTQGYTLDAFIHFVNLHYKMIKTVAGSKLCYAL
jgi:hypothetical protein